MICDPNIAAGHSQAQLQADGGVEGLADPAAASGVTTELPKGVKVNDGTELAAVTPAVEPATYGADVTAETATVLLSATTADEEGKLPWPA